MDSKIFIILNGCKRKYFNYENLMYLSILIFPLLGSISAGFLGRKIGVTGAHIITCTCLIISSILITVAFYEVGICGSPVTIYLFNWIDSEFMSISWEFLFDQLTVSLSLAVIYCSTLIHIYSVDYLSTDPAKCYGKTFIGYKLSNSGEPLKLLVPSYSRKAISGWSNYSCTVTSHKIDENKMGNRGSKSDFNPDSYSILIFTIITFYALLCLRVYGPNFPFLLLLLLLLWPTLMLTKQNLKFLKKTLRNPVYILLKQGYRKMLYWKFYQLVKKIFLLL